MPAFFVFCEFSVGWKLPAENIPEDFGSFLRLFLSVGNERNLF